MAFHMKRLPGIVLVLAVAAVSCKEKASTPAAQPAALPKAIQPAVQGPPTSVTVYYFHGNRRCKTCLGIQKTIEDTVRDRFGGDVQDKRLVYQDINTDDPANKQYTEDFQLSFSSMVVVAMNGAQRVKWENCDKVWEYAHDEPRLAQYTAERIGAFLAMIEKK